MLIKIGNVKLKVNGCNLEIIGTPKQNMNPKSGPKKQQGKQGQYINLDGFKAEHGSQEYSLATEITEIVLGS